MYKIDFAVLLKYNSRNIHRIKVCGIFLWKTMWLLFQILSSQKSSVWHCFIVQYQYTELLVWTDTVLCDICHNAMSNFQVLLYLCIIKLQSCHLLPYQVPQFPIIWDHSAVRCKFPSCGQSPYHSTVETFVDKLARLTLQVYFNMMSSICCTNLFVCGRSVTLQIWQGFLFR